MTGRRFPTYDDAVDVTPTTAGPRARPSSAPSPPPPSEDEIFAALASPVRREVLRLLRERGPRSVQELASGFAMARPSFSEHLRVLREAGLVSERRDGRRRLYSLEPVPLVRVRDWLDPYERFWRDRLSALRHLLDDTETADNDTDGTKTVDAGTSDTGTSDTGTSDTGTSDTETTGGTTTDTATASAGVPPYGSGGGHHADHDEERP
ncbi:helix-turn-helix transcriptional regulator [Microbispora sp. SCL1-1]|nr:metalloregulator ArsR/SmtB family transcription factor [Microbispora sp. CL1-1]NJP29397.1 helix-turn-helix transcriptional regulator [Microbispora sp. CL1-1]TQS05402.1 helix-turn-helix transcriptional regulator [Microbispora sp. SCL1-1]